MNLLISVLILSLINLSQSIVPNDISSYQNVVNVYSQNTHQILPHGYGFKGGYGPLYEDPNKFLIPKYFGTFVQNGFGQLPRDKFGFKTPGGRRIASVLPKVQGLRGVDRFGRPFYIGEIRGGPRKFEKDQVTEREERPGERRETTDEELLDERDGGREQEGREGGGREEGREGGGREEGREERERGGREEGKSGREEGGRFERGRKGRRGFGRERDGGQEGGEERRRI